MDKDSVILKYEQERTDDIEKETLELEKSSKSQEERLKEMESKLQGLYAKAGKKPLKKRVSQRLKEFKKGKPEEQSELTYDELFALAEESLKERGLSPDEMDYQDLVSEEDINEIIRELNEPIPREATWKKSDYIIVFIAAVLGCAVDIVLSNRDNKLTGKGSKFEQKLRQIHDKTHPHAQNAPIDYQGKGFGGGMHRSRTRGHDPLRFVEGIKQFKNGTFEGVYYQNNMPIHVKVGSNQFGTPYGQLSMIDAVIRYLDHMIKDFCSAASLPFPGFSFLAESNSRQIRKLSADMYENGFNCRNIATQSLSAIIIEMIIRLYFSIQSVQTYMNNVEIAEDYSYFEAIKQFFKPANKEKLYEMLLVAHSIVTAVNVGKIVIEIVASEGGALAPALSKINIAEIIAVVNYGAKVTNATLKRTNEYNKVVYYFDGVGESWESLDKELTAGEIEAITSIERD